MPLMKTLPASSSRASRSASARSRVQAAAPRPNGVALASAIASSMPATRNSGATGPNTSSRAAGAVGRHVGEHRRRVEVARARRAAARPSSRRAPAATERVDLVGDAVADRRAAPAARPRCRARVGSPTRSARHRRREVARERVVDRVGDDEALGGDARLAVVDDARLHRRRDRARQVGARQHDERVAAAQLEHALLDVLAGGRRDRRARRPRCRSPSRRRRDRRR